MLQLPEQEQSIWRDAYPDEPTYPQLITQVKADVIVVGAGITGLTAAYELMKAGKSVVVLEKDTVGAGTTGRTTGKVTSQHGMLYAHLWRSRGRKNTKAYAEANQAAVERVKHIVKQEKIACDWQEDDNYIFTDSYDHIQYMKHEAEISADVGLPASFVTDTPLPFTVKGAIRFKYQGKFHAQKYLLGLAKAVDDARKCHVFEHSRAIGFRDGTQCRVTTMKGAVEASRIIVATHVPTWPLLARTGYALLEYPTESFAIAGPLERQLSGMYISPDENHFSVQPISIDGKSMLIIVGAGGNIPGLAGNTRKRYERLADYAEKRFGIREITHRWSDMDYFAYDDLPLVGKVYPWSKHMYTASGFRKWGLSMGTAAGSILADLVTGKKNKYINSFNSIRTRPLKQLPRTALNYVRSNLL